MVLQELGNQRGSDSPSEWADEGWPQVESQIARAFIDQVLPEQLQWRENFAVPEGTRLPFRNSRNVRAILRLCAEAKRFDAMKSIFELSGEPSKSFSHFAFCESVRQGGDELAAYLLRTRSEELLAASPFEQTYDAALAARVKPFLEGLQTDQGWQLHYSEHRPFGVDPEDAYVAIFSPPDTLIRVPSPPLTHLSVTDDGACVIGLSNIKFLNLAQLVVYEMRGRLLLRRRITAQLHCLSIDRFKAAKLEYPEIFAALDRHTTLTQVGYGWREADVVYLELPYLTEPMADLYDALTASRCDSPYSPNFSESITNLIHWYQAEDPQPVVVEKDGRPFEVRLRDPAGLTFGVKFKQTPLTNPHD